MEILASLGKYAIMLRRMISRPENMRMYWREVLRQMNNIGVGSLVIVGIISFFTGAVTAVQFAAQLLGGWFPPYLLGFIIRDSMIIELAPTLSSLVLAGKVGSNMASELGTMRISEQIDALEIMGINSTAYLVAPKIIASLIIVPPLIILSAYLGIYGGLLAATYAGVAPEMFIKGLRYMFDPYNVFVMQVKAVVFAFLITSVACFYGYYVEGGALEIGRASTKAVVNGSILVVFFDYIIAVLLT